MQMFSLYTKKKIKLSIINKKNQRSNRLHKFLSKEVRVHNTHAFYSILITILK